MAFLLDFVAKTQNPSVPDPQFDEFMVPSLDSFVESDQDELFVSTFPGLSNIILVLRIGMWKNWVSCNTISF